MRTAAALAPSEDDGLEAQLHYAEALSFLTAPEVAIAEYHKVIERAPGSPLAPEAKCGIAALKYWLGDLRDAKTLFLEVARETQDWATLKECVARLKHLQRLIGLEEHHPGRRAKDCGPKAFEGGLTRALTYACCALATVSDSTGTVGFDVDAVGRLRHPRSGVSPNAADSVA